MRNLINVQVEVVRAGPSLPRNLIVDVSTPLGRLLIITMRAAPDRNHEVLKVALLPRLRPSEMRRHADEMGVPVAPILHRLGPVIKDMPTHATTLDDSRAVDVLTDDRERWQLVSRRRCRRCHACCHSKGDSVA